MIMERKHVIEIIRKSLVSSYGDTLTDSDTDKKMAESAYRALHRKQILNQVFYNSSVQVFPTVEK